MIASLEVIQLKVVSLHCTWAGLIRAGALTGKTYKQHETRSRSGAIGKDYRGWLAIASTQKPNQPDWDIIKQVTDIAGDEATKNRLRDFDLYEPGHILALVRVTDAFEMTPENIAKQSPLEIATGDWQPGRWAFRLENAIALPTPIPYTAKSQGATYVEPESELGQQLIKIINTFKCSSLTNCSAELADSVKPQNSQEGSLSETTLTSTPTPKLSTDTTTQALLSTETSGTITPSPEPMSRSLDFPARAHQELVLALDSITPNPVFGLKPCDASSRGVQTMWLLKTLKVLSTEDYGKFLADSEWLDIRGTIRSSYQQLGSELLTGETDSSLLPTPTTYPGGSDTHRPAGTNKLERTLKLLPTVTASTGGVTQDLSKGGNRLERSLLPTPVARDGKGPTGTLNESLSEPIQEYLTGTDKMNPRVPGWMMGFQPGYVEEILMVGGEITQPQFIQVSQPEQKDAEVVSSSTAEASCPNKPRSHSTESSTSTQSLENEVMVQSAERTTQKAQAFDRYIEGRINAEGEDIEEPNERLEFISPLEINLERGSQTRVSKNAKGVKELKEKMESGVWRFDDPSDCPILIELTEDYLVKRQGLEPFWVRQGELIPAIGHTRIESGQELQQFKSDLKMLCRIRKGTWFDVIQLGGTSDIESAHPKTTSDRTYACTRLIELLFERYGSLENIPMRGRGKAGADLEEEWGTAKLSKMFGISPNTVTKLYQSVELNTQIADYPDGTRVQLIENSEFPLPWFLKNLVGALGVVSGSAPKEGLFVSFDQYNPEYVHPRFLQKSDAPLLVAPTKPASQHSSTKSELKEQARSLGIRPGAQSLPSSASNPDIPPGELQAEPITPAPLNKEEETEVPPSQNHTILPIPTTSNGRIPETYNFAAKTDVNLREATRTVVENLHRLTSDELLALEEAIAQAKASWSQEAAA